MQAFDFINDIAHWFADLVPKWDLLEPTMGGVKFKPGGKVVELKPGHIYWWWPATTKIETIPIKRRTLTFGQRLTTSDEVTVQCNTVIVFTVEDVTKAIVETTDFDDTIGEVAQKVTIRPIMSRNFDKILSDMADSNKMRNEVTSNARSNLTDYGVAVVDGYVCDFTETKVISIDGDGLILDHEEEEDE
jgi:regulator of protease activity HflC (stomatin/prohibitin superfamily)